MMLNQSASLALQDAEKHNFYIAAAGRISLCAVALSLVGCSSATAPSLTTQSVTPPRPAQSYQAPQQVGAENGWDAASSQSEEAYRPAPRAPTNATPSGGRDYEYRGGRDPVTGKAYTQIGAEEEPAR